MDTWDEEKSKAHKQKDADLVMLINVSCKETLLTSSEVGWISNSKVILTLNN